MSLAEAATVRKIDLSLLEDLAGLPSGAARFGTCIMCGRPLTNLKSMEKGIGPECERKVTFENAP